MAKLVKQLSSKDSHFYSSLFKKIFPLFVKDFLRLPSRPDDTQTRRNEKA